MSSVTLERYINNHIDFINSVSSFISIDHLDNTLAIANQFATKELGFSNQDESINVAFSKIPCSLSEHAEDFSAQNEKTLVQGSVRYLAYLDYAPKEMLALCEKSVININGKPKGILVRVMDLTDSGLVDLSRYLMGGEKTFFYDVPDQKNLPYTLTEKQMECLFLLLRGYSTKSMASILSLSPRTVEDHIARAKVALDCYSKAQLLQKAHAEGLFSVLPKNFLNGKFRCW